MVKFLISNNNIDHTAPKGKRIILLSANLFNHIMQTNLLGLWTLNPDVAFKCFFFCM